MIPQAPICKRCELLSDQPWEVFCSDCDEDWVIEWDQKNNESFDLEVTS